MTLSAIIHRFANDERTHRDHAYTFVVLANQWHQQGQPDLLPIDPAQLLAVLKTKRSTLFDWLRQLETFGYIQLQQRINQHQKSTVRLLFGDTLNRTATETVDSAYTPNRTATPQVNTSDSLLIPEIGRHIPESDSNQVGDTPNRTAEYLAIPEIGQQLPVGDTSNRTATRLHIPQIGQQPNQAEVIHTKENLDLAAVSLIVSGLQSYPHRPPAKEVVTSLAHAHVGAEEESIISSPYVSNRKEGAGRKRENTKSETAKRNRDGPLGSKPTDVPFLDSPMGDPGAFAEYVTGKYPDIDPRYYFEKVANWRQNDEPPKRTNWKTTINEFLLRDYKNADLVTITRTTGTPERANHATANYAQSQPARYRADQPRHRPRSNGQPTPESRAEFSQGIDSILRERYG
jgi:hypothetical protein